MTLKDVSPAKWVVRVVSRSSPAGGPLEAILAVNYSRFCCSFTAICFSSGIRYQFVFQKLFSRWSGLQDFNCPVFCRSTCVKSKCKWEIKKGLQLLPWSPRQHSVAMTFTDARACKRACERVREIPYSKLIIYVNCLGFCVCTLGVSINNLCVW